MQVYHLPLSEAAAAVQSQLSPQGSVVPMASRRILVVNDDARHLEQARALLKRLDLPASNLRVHVELLEVERRSLMQLAANGRLLPGGWLQLQVGASSLRLSQRTRQALLLASGSEGRIEAGELLPVATRTRNWLRGLGISESQQVELVPITAGFVVSAFAVGEQATLTLRPWLRRLANPQMDGNTVIVTGGSGGTPVVQLGNGQTKPTSEQLIEVRAAETTLTLPLGESVLIAAHSDEADELGLALLSLGQSSQNREFLIRLTVER